MEEEEEEEGECPICLDTHANPAITGCGHRFCLRCIIGVLARLGPVCPLCRGRPCFVSSLVGHGTDLARPEKRDLIEEALISPERAFNLSQIVREGWVDVLNVAALCWEGTMDAERVFVLRRHEGAKETFEAVVGQPYPLTTIRRIVHLTEAVAEATFPKILTDDELDSNYDMNTFTTYYPINRECILLSGVSSTSWLPIEGGMSERKGPVLYCFSLLRKLFESKSMAAHYYGLMYYSSERTWAL